MGSFFKHLHTINSHRRLVKSMCFKCGMYKQGLLHDLSKYSPSEFIPSVKYYQGYRSPISAEKAEKGYSECWLHHKGRNKHHWEYWIDPLLKDNEYKNIPMPQKYILESVLDKIAASKVYKKSEYNEQYPLEFFDSSREKNLMHPENARRIRYYLEYLANNGEDKTLTLIKNDYKSIKNN